MSQDDSDGLVADIERKPQQARLQPAHSPADARLPVRRATPLPEARLPGDTPPLATPLNQREAGIRESVVLHNHMREHSTKPGTSPERESL